MHAGQCWWVSALHAGGYWLCLLAGICSVCPNAGGISALHRAGQCWGGYLHAGQNTMLHHASMHHAAFWLASALHAGGYMLCVLQCWWHICPTLCCTMLDKARLPLEATEATHLHDKSASQGYCTQSPSTRQHCKHNCSCASNRSNELAQIQFQTKGPTPSKCKHEHHLEPTAVSGWLFQVCMLKAMEPRRWHTHPYTMNSQHRKWKGY